MLSCVGRKWDPAVSRVGIGRTAALWGIGCWKARAHNMRVLSLSYEPGRLLYLCRSGCAQNGGGQTAGAGGGRGTPGMGREAWLSCSRVGSPHCPGGPGRTPVLGPCFRKSRLTPLPWTEEREQPFGKAVAAPSPAARGLRRARQP